MYSLLTLTSILPPSGPSAIVNSHLLRYPSRTGWNVWKGKLMDGMRSDFMYCVAHHIAMVVLKGPTTFHATVNLCPHNKEWVLCSSHFFQKSSILILVMTATMKFHSVKMHFSQYMQKFVNKNRLSLLQSHRKKCKWASLTDTTPNMSSRQCLQAVMEQGIPTHRFYTV